MGHVRGQASLHRSFELASQPIRRILLDRTLRALWTATLPGHHSPLGDLVRIRGLNTQAHCHPPRLLKRTEQAALAVFLAAPRAIHRTLAFIDHRTPSRYRASRECPLGPLRSEHWNQNLGFCHKPPTSGDSL